MRLPAPSLLFLLPFALLVACEDGNGTLDDDSAAGDDDDDTTPLGDDDATGDDDDDDDDTTPGDDDDDDDDNTPEPIELEDYFPSDNETDVFVGSILWAEWSDSPTSADVVLTEVGTGTAVAGDSLWVSDVRAVFEPDAPLLPSTDYQVDLTWDDQSHTWTFTTGTDGTVPLGLDPTGLVFAWDLAAGTVISPPGGEQALAQIPAAVLTEVTAVDGTALTMLGGLATEGSNPPAQDLCNATFDLTGGGAALFEDPGFTAGPTEFNQTFDVPFIGPVPFVMHDATFSGIFEANSAGDAIESISYGTVTGFINVSELGGIDCGTLSFIGVTCGQCPDDPSENTCLTFVITDLEAEVVPGLDLVARTQEEVDADAACQ